MVNPRRYKLIPIAAGTDKLGNKFTTILVEQSPDTKPQVVAYFNHPSCIGFKAGCSWKRNISTLEMLIPDEVQRNLALLNLSRGLRVVIVIDDLGSRVFRTEK